MKYIQFNAQLLKDIVGLSLTELKDKFNPEQLTEISNSRMTKVHNNIIELTVLGAAFVENYDKKEKEWAEMTPKEPDTINPLQFEQSK